MNEAHVNALREIAERQIEEGLNAADVMADLIRAAYDMGQTAGYWTGKDEGYEEGNQEGNLDGYKKGNQNGYKDGWDYGFNAGVKHVMELNQ